MTVELLTDKILFPDVSAEDFSAAQARLLKRQAEEKSRKQASSQNDSNLSDIILFPLSSSTLPSARSMDDQKEVMDYKANIVSAKNKRMAEEIVSMMEYDAAEIGMVSYMSQMLVQMMLPHSEHKDAGGHPINEYKRENGRATLTIMTPSIYGGVPYGVVPRQLLMWLTTEAVRLKSREIFLGDSLTSFLKEMGVKVTGGKEGSLLRIRKQSNRLFNSFINYDPGLDTNSRRHNLIITDSNESFSFWSENNCKAWESHIVLSDQFFQEIIQNPVPIDRRAIRALSGSAFALDLYCWLTWRLYSVKKYTSIPWEYLQSQFGSSYKHLRQFRDRFKHVLDLVLEVYPANVRVEQSCLVLLPSVTSIPRKSVQL